MVKIKPPQLRQAELPSVNAFVTDTFYKPDRKPTNPALGDLANSLSSIVPTLRRFDIQKEEIFKLDEQERAIADFEANKNAFKELTKKGVIPEGASPYYINALAKQQLKLDGREFKDQLFAEYQKNNVLFNDEPGALEKFYRTFSEQFRQDKKLDSYAPATLVEGFLPDANAAYNELAQRHREGRIAEIEKQNIDLLNKNINGIFSDYQSLEDEQVNLYLVNKGIIPNQEDSEANNQKYLALQVQEQIDFLTDNGMNFRTANETAVDAITAFAIEYLDEDYLEIIDDIRTNGNSKLGSTQYAKEKIVDTSFTIERLRQQKIDNDYKNNQRKKIEDSLLAVNDYYNFLLADKNNASENVLTYFQNIQNQREADGLEPLDLSALNELFQFQEGYLKAKDPLFIEDKEIINGFEKQILTNPYSQDLYSVIIGQVGESITAETATSLIEKAQNAQNFNTHPYKGDTRYVDIFRFFNNRTDPSGVGSLEQQEIDLRVEGVSILTNLANEILVDLQNPEYRKQQGIVTDSQARLHMYGLLNKEADRLKGIIIGQEDYQAIVEENQEQINQMRDRNYIPKDGPNSFDEFDEGTN